MKNLTNIPENCKYSSIYDNVEYSVNISPMSHSTEATIVIKCAKNRGHSIGNAIRREILSSAESFAIAGIRIHGVNHQYASIKGVMNQISEIIANLKKVIIVSRDSYIVNDDNKHHVYSAVLHHDSAKGHHIVTAEHIKLSDNLMALNPAQEICRLDVNSSVMIDIAIIYGQGFLSQDNIKFIPTLSNDFIKLDANFANNISVSVNVDENNRSITTDILTINIVTSVAHNALETYHKAVKSYLSLLNVLNITAYELKHEIQNLNSAKHYKVSNTTLDTSLHTLTTNGYMPHRLYIILNKYGINTIRDLTNLNEQQLLLIDGLGKGAIEEIKKLMNEYKSEFAISSENNTLGKRQVNTNIIDNDMIGSKSPKTN